MHSNSTHVWSQLQHASQWGRLINGDNIGLCRESLSDSDRMVRDWFVAEAKDLGCHIRVDSMGNIFAIMEGENMSLPPIGMGSHLDSQPLGGRFDGSLGVIAALEVLRKVKESGVKTYAPLAAINWTNEEGSRFLQMCSGSSVWSGAHSQKETYSLLDYADASATLYSDLKRINYLGTTPCTSTSNPLSAHFELHIEQGTRLENTHNKVGVVTGVQGMRWYDIHCEGAECHAGACPVSERADALVTIAKFIVMVEHLSLKYEAFGTVGIVNVATSSPNTVPGSAFCTLDLRHTSDEVLDKVEEMLQAFLRLMERNNVDISISMTKKWANKSVSFNKQAQESVRVAAAEVVGSSRVMDLESHAAHDSAEVAKVVPTAMTFVPSKDGISHNPAEFTSEEDCDIGAEVLLRSVLVYDEYLRSNEQN